MEGNWHLVAGASDFVFFEPSSSVSVFCSPHSNAVSAVHVLGGARSPFVVPSDSHRCKYAAIFGWFSGHSGLQHQLRVPTMASDVVKPSTKLSLWPCVYPK